MSIETELYTKLSGTAAITAIVSTRMSPSMSPQSDTLPRLDWTVISKVPVNGASGASETSNSRVQIDCWASTYSGVKALADAVRTALSGWRDTGLTTPVSMSLLLGENDLPTLPPDATDVPVHRVSMDFSIWHS